MEVTNNFSPPKKGHQHSWKPKTENHDLKFPWCLAILRVCGPFWDGENVTRDPKSKAKNRNLQQTGNEMVTLHLVLRFDGRNPAPDDR